MTSRIREWWEQAVAVVSRSEAAVDGGIAVACYLATVALPVKALATTGWSLFVLAAITSVPLVWRRRHPVGVAAVVGAGTLGLAATGLQTYIPVPYGQIVATYAVAALASWYWRLLVSLATGAGVAFAVLGLLHGTPSTAATALLPFVAAYAIGTGTRARRAQIGLLEERAARLSKEKQAAVTRERERIAREIHDIVAHSVSLMVVQAESGAILAGDRDKSRVAFDTISATGREAVGQLDRALGVLRGDAVDRKPQPGLAQLPGLARQARSAGLDATLVVVGEPRSVPADLAATVYRVVQEALTNTIKHAQAAHVAVELDWRDAELRLIVTDDGVGPSSGTHGRGLIGMRERVRAYGGTLTAGPAIGSGFEVIATLPFPLSIDAADGHE